MVTTLYDDTHHVLTIARTSPSLPQLMQVVSNEENSDVISWLPHGKGFIIYKKKKFASDILPRYFKQRYDLLRQRNDTGFRHDNSQFTFLL